MVIALIRAYSLNEQIAKSSANTKSNWDLFKLDFSSLINELKNMMNKYGDIRDPWGTPMFIGIMSLPFIEER